MVPLFSIAAIPKNKEREKMRGGKRNMEQTRILVRYRPSVTSKKIKTTEWVITAIPPKEGTQYYGTGYYITAVPLKKNGTPDEEASVYWDMRYAETTDIDTMADYWVRDYYGGTYTKKVKYYVP